MWWDFRLEDSARSFLSKVLENKIFHLLRVKEDVLHFGDGELTRELTRE